jgi:hypothetical protein
MGLFPLLALAALLLLLASPTVSGAERVVDRRRLSDSRAATATPGDRQPRIAVVNSQPFHLEIVAGLVDATSAFRGTTTYFLDPAVFPRGERNLGFIPWIQDVKCECGAVPAGRSRRAPLPPASHMRC